MAKQRICRGNVATFDLKSCNLGSWWSRVSQSKHDVFDNAFADVALDLSHEFWFEKSQLLEPG